ncbi:hypothetical protein BKA62DRAFT_693002 [Auriculariales sp. MPI-PUGE-AT-0066]|nr:hypothetical protein BKA62DRAFT_693002 [Auriculariales sp. MPI-PUGE-AT-0066]
MTDAGNTLPRAAMAESTPTADNKDLRRRGVELDMAHKAHDRAKGGFHSAKGRSSCTSCSGGHPRVSRGAPAVFKRDTVSAESEAREQLDSASSGDDFTDDSADDQVEHVVSGAVHRCSQDCEHIMGARVVVRSLRKRKGVGRDFEFIPSATQGIRILSDDMDVSVPDMDDWERVELDVPPASVPRSYSAAVRA